MDNSNERGTVIYGEETVSTAKFFWFNVLYSLPFVGFILSVIMSFAAENTNFKNFSRSFMIKYFISIGISLVIMGSFIAVCVSVGKNFDDIVKYIEELVNNAK